MPYALLGVLLAGPLEAQGGSNAPDTLGMTIEITPPSSEGAVGQRLSFRALVRDASGKTLTDPPTTWFTMPVDVAAADSTGGVALYRPGQVQVLAMVGGKVGGATVTVKPARAVRVDVEPLRGPLVVGGSALVAAVPRISNGDPRLEAPVSWTSDHPAIARIDPAGFVTGVAPGRATLTARAEDGSGTLAVEVVENPVRRLAVEPGSAEARTGDVVHFATLAGDARGGRVDDPAIRWAVSGDGATIDPDGAFVAERPGTYSVTSASGDRVAAASVLVRPRDVERKLEVVGRVPMSDLQATEQWIFGTTAYLSSIADRVWVFDVSDPAHPVKTDSIMVDARAINDVSTTADHKIGVLTREGASSRKNGIVFFDASDPLHPKVVSEYTETVTGGVHSAFIDGHYVYLTDNATGSLRVIDFGDVKNPKQVARWQVEDPVYRKEDVPGAAAFSAGRYLHDVQVKDGLIYLAYWRDGLVVLDVGKGIKGGSPENPQLVSRLRFNHSELYGPGWVAGTHTVFRYKDYLFVGDEVFPAHADIQSRARISARGILHVVDVADIEHPRAVAWYAVPEAGAHNVWVEDDMLMMGYYGGGARVLDVSGELRGDLYAQGREIGRLWTGDPAGYRSNLPLTWGAQPHAGLIYFNDINSGLWIIKLGEPNPHGSTTEAGD